MAFGRDDGVPVRDDKRYKYPDGCGTPGMSAKTARGRKMMHQKGTLQPVTEPDRSGSTPMQDED